MRPDWRLWEYAVAISNTNSQIVPIIAKKETNVSFVFVTGASKGIGAACTRVLAARGHHVFAGVRNSADGENLRTASPDRITPLIVDVTNPSAIQAAARTIDDVVGAAGLAGLVNNAGIAVAGPLEFLPIDELRHQLEVNVIGQIAVLQAVMPSIRKATGRVVLMGSIAGRSALPLLGPYAASKHALEALADSLRVELMPWGIHVAIIEPGVIATPIWDTSLASATRTRERMPAEATERYGRIIEALTKRVQGGTVRGLPPERVAKVVEHALFAPKPKPRYMVGRDARLRAMLQVLLPDRWRDRIISRQLAKL
jgi:NAD(P)-dependent dehydrogenase (short-subunit alcohol dehydrogenase family)